MKLNESAVRCYLQAELFDVDDEKCAQLDFFGGVFGKKTAKHPLKCF